MAYQSERREATCAACEKITPYFKMIVSTRSEHQRQEPMTLAEAEGKEPATGLRGNRICCACELECRKKEWP
eukprot:5533096-Prorocentrum_lima.AAC.1